MLGLGWSEMLVIGVVVLIVVGPKDLPVMMRNLGRMMGTVRRMSNEFRREIDKAIAADEIRDARKALSDPLKQTSEDISREFNSIRDGKVEPSGKLAPSEPGKESVVDEIRAQAGMDPKPEPSPAAQALRAKVSETVAKPTPEAAAVPEPKAEAKPKVKAAPRKAAAKAAEPGDAKPAAKSTAKPAAKKAPAKKPAARKPASKKAAPARAKSEG